MVKRVYERWARGDFSVDPELMAADFVWHQRRGAVEPGSHRGGGIGASGRRFGGCAGWAGPVPPPGCSNR